MKKFFIAGIFILMVGILIIKSDVLKSFKEDSVKQEINTKVKEDKLDIISTNPDPLENAVILPTQDVEIKFNKIVEKSEFKHKFDPEVEHEVENFDHTSGTTFKIKFKKPLELGHGYTLFILPNTNSIDGKTLDKEIIYHITTIKYKGV